MAEEKASAERDHCQKPDEKLVQANSKITELEAKLMSLQRELAVLQTRTKEHKSVVITAKHLNPIQNN